MPLRGILNTFLRSFESGLVPLNRIEINKSVLLDNLNWYRGQFEGEVWPVLKSNAYGHGLREVATILQNENISYLVVDSYYEALKIWEVNPKQRILLIGSVRPENLVKLDYSKIALMVQDEEILKQLAKINHEVKIHLKINTGMGRQGVDLAELEYWVGEVKKYKNIEVEGVMSHLADADNDDKSFTLSQIKKFEIAKQLVWEGGLTPKYWHLAATSGCGKLPVGLTNSMRLGLGLYLGKQPVLQMWSTLTKVREINKGDRVSYNGIFVAPRKMRIGIVPVGYFEGIPRRLSAKGFMKISDKYAQILGRVCMNLTIIGLENIAAKEGDKVGVISDQPRDKNSIESMAKLAETIPHEILTGLDGSIKRIIV